MHIGPIYAKRGEVIVAFFNLEKQMGPVFLKEDSSAEIQLTALQELAKTADHFLAEQLEEEIKCVRAGIHGEDAIKFELQNSHIPMVILHDLYLEYEGLSAQIDYLIITRYHQFVLECKNLYGNIEINSNGDFIRTMSFGKKVRKEGIYSPITQNRRHLELIKQIRSAEKKNFLTKTLFEKNFYDNYRAIVVLANPKTVLNARYAKKEVRDQVLRADQLAEYIRKTDASSRAEPSNEKEMRALAEFFLARHQQPPVDYTEKFRAKIPSLAIQSAELTQTSEAPSQILCPKCGAVMVKRQASKGPNAGKEFYGCPNFPKCRGIVIIV